jgi:hypothetical protein
MRLKRSAAGGISQLYKRIADSGAGAAGGLAARVRPFLPKTVIWPAYQGSGPSSFENVPVGPFASRSASRTGSRATPAQIYADECIQSFSPI